MPRKVTYAAFGYIDWVARIPLGKARMTVRFSGGALSKYGSVPAEFTTSDPFTQEAIEKSDYFRKGKIKILRSCGRHEIRHPTKPSAKPDSYALPIETTKPAVLAEQEEVSLTIDDAIFMLSSRFSIPAVRIRTPESAIAVASQHGIRLNIIKR